MKTIRKLTTGLRVEKRKEIFENKSADLKISEATIIDLHSNLKINDPELEERQKLNEAMKQYHYMYL